VRKKLIIALAIALVIALVTVGSLLYFSGGEKGIVIFNYSDDPFRRDVANSVRSTLATLGAQWEDVQLRELPPSATSDDIPWAEVSVGSVVIVLIAPGAKPLPDGRLIVMGPMRNVDAQFIAENRGRARFCVSDFPVDLSIGRITSASGLAEGQITIGVASPSVALRAAGQLAGRPVVVCDERGEFTASVPSLSCLLLMADGISPSAVATIASLCAEKKIAVVVDRKGYLTGSVAAVISAEPDGAGETLARLAWRSRTEGHAEEVRELAVLFSAQNPGAVRRLNLKFDDTDFPPLAR
jgi:hypothetical protein